MQILLPLSLGALVLLWVIWRLYRHASMQASEALPDVSWLEEFTVQRYRPMERLLNEEDFEFFRSQAGYEPKIEKALRLQRRYIFGLYFRSLRRDFERLHRAACLMLVLTPEDRPDLAKQLLRAKMVFLWACALIQARLLLYRFGLRPIEVSGLFKPVESLHGCVRFLMQAAEV
jgi:hypothetical protein